MSSVSIDQVCQFLSQLAPLSLAESWDNVGLLVGERDRVVVRVMTCLTVTPDVTLEAHDEKADLLVTHHPLPFKPLGRITSDTMVGAMLLRLIQSRTAIYSAHTAFDSAIDGINQMWAHRLGLTEIQPLIEQQPMAEQQLIVEQQRSELSQAQVLPSADVVAARVAPSSLGAGRYGVSDTADSLADFAKKSAALVQSTNVRVVGPPDHVVRKVAIACGSGGSFLAAAKRNGCDTFVTGEATFHTCLEAESLGLGLVLLGHYQSERFAMEFLSTRVGERFPGLTVWASRRERDPIWWQSQQTH